MNDPVSELAMYKAAVRAEWDRMHQNTYEDLMPPEDIQDCPPESLPRNGDIVSGGAGEGAA